MDCSSQILTTPASVRNTPGSRAKSRLSTAQQIDDDPGANRGIDRTVAEARQRWECS